LAPSRVSRIRPLLVLASFLTVWWLAPVAVRSFSKASFSLFEAPGELAYSRLKDIQDYWGLREHEQDSLIEAGRDAMHQANNLQLELQKSQSLQDDNQRLADLLHLPPEPGFRYEYARVIRRDVTAWWQQIIIRKGRVDGLAPGQGVVFAGGVVGRIKEVDAYTAVVELSSSQSFREAAELVGSPDPVIYQGVETEPFHAPTGEAHNISINLNLEPGQELQLVTSSYDSVFPQGLSLGQINRLQKSTNGLDKSGLVSLDPRLNNLHEVAVLVPDQSTAPIIPSKPASPARPASTSPRRPGASQ
jgi:rod shape-determining protein MreC